MTATDYIKGLRLKHFTADEILTLGASHEHNGLNTLPPADLWPNIVRTAWIADISRERLGSSIQILSGYRSPGYNKAIGGAKFSQHLDFNALDLGTSRTVALYNLLVKLRDAGAFRGGIGKYSTFVHLDTRGSNATW